MPVLVPGFQLATTGSVRVDRPLSIGGFPVGVAVCGAFEYVRGRPDLRLRRLQDRVPCLPGPGREGLAQVAVVRVLGGDRQALPVGEPLGESAVRGGQVGNPLAHLAGRLARGESELGALGFGRRFGFSRAERGEVLVGVAAAEFGVGGDGQVALGAGGGVPVGAVGHGRGEDGLPLPVGLVQGLVAGGEFLLAGGGVVVAALGGGGGFGGGAQAGQAGVAGGGADLAELVSDLWRGPGSLDRVGVAQVQQPAVGHAAHVGPVGGAEGGEGFVPGRAQVRGGRDRFGADRVGGVAVAG